MTIYDSCVDSGNGSYTSESSCFDTGIGFGFVGIGEICPNFMAGSDTGIGFGFGIDKPCPDECSDGVCQSRFLKFIDAFAKHGTAAPKIDLNATTSYASYLEDDTGINEISVLCGSGKSVLAPGIECLPVNYSNTKAKAPFILGMIHADTDLSGDSWDKLTAKCAGLPLIVDGENSGASLNSLCVDEAVLARCRLITSISENAAIPAGAAYAVNIASTHCAPGEKVLYGTGSCLSPGQARSYRAYMYRDAYSSFIDSEGHELDGWAVECIGKPDTAPAQSSIVAVEAMCCPEHGFADIYRVSASKETAVITENMGITTSYASCDAGDRVLSGGSACHIPSEIIS